LQKKTQKTRKERSKNRIDWNDRRLQLKATSHSAYYFNSKAATKQRLDNAETSRKEENIENVAEAKEENSRMSQ